MDHGVYMFCVLLYMANYCHVVSNLVHVLSGAHVLM